MYKRKFKVSRYKSDNNKKVAAIAKEDQMPFSPNTLFPTMTNNTGSEEEFERTTKLKEVPSHTTPSELHHTYWLWSALDINNPMAYISTHME